MENSSTYLNQREAASYLRLGETTLEKLRLSGRGPRYSKPLKRILYRKADLDSWVDSHIRRSTSERSAA